MAKKSVRRKTKRKIGKAQSARPRAVRSQGSLKAHGDKLAHAVREAAEKPPRRDPQ
jgi:hypothetical protein